ncbi:MAG: CocE/NonD family hydrolase [Actinomycetota bacterium]|nr:CocE/NonD family hydrolase [Actinomycetota bacterium]
MTRRSKQIFGTLLGVCLVAGGLLLPAGSAGAQRARGGDRSGGVSVPGSITRRGQAFDYRDLKPKLSKVQYGEDQIIREKFKIPMSTGDLGACPEPSETPCPVELHAEVVRPKADKQYPVILEVSPYHGTIANRSGTRIFPGPKAQNPPDYVDAQEERYYPEDKTIGLAGYFAPRGYAVVFVDLRGTGKSDGCLDHLGRRDQRDAKDVLQFLSDPKKAPWSNGRIGMTGHSYVGSTPQMYAAVQERDMKATPLKTIVPSAGLAAMYHHKFQHGVPYYLQWIGPAVAYIQLAYQRSFPGFLGIGYEDAPPPEHAEFYACEAENSAVMSLEDFESGRYDNRDESLEGPNGFIAAPWDSERDFRLGVTRADIPVFAVHGVNDNAARIPALDWFHERYGRHDVSGDKAWIGQWDHGSNYYPVDRTCQEHTTQVRCPNDQWTLALHAWFDKHLKQRKVSTGPGTSIFLSDRRSSFETKEWPPRPQNRGVPFYLHPSTNENGTMKLLPFRMSNDDGYGAESFVGSPDTFVNEASEDTEVNGPDDNALGWDTPPFKEDVILAGIPKLRLFASVLADPATPPHIHATLYDVAPNGDVVCVVATYIDQRCGISKATFAMNPELAQGPKYVKQWFKPTQRTPIAPGPACPTAGTPCPHRMQLKTRGMAQAYLLKEGHRLRLAIATSQPDKPPTRPDGEVTVYMSRQLFSKISVPIVSNARIRRDPFYLNGGADFGSFPP